MQVDAEAETTYAVYCPSATEAERAMHSGVVAKGNACIVLLSLVSTPLKSETDL